jgi:hypothetical protein
VDAYNDPKQRMYSAAVSDRTTGEVLYRTPKRTTSGEVQNLAQGWVDRQTSKPVEK